MRLKRDTLFLEGHACNHGVILGPHLGPKAKYPITNDKEFEKVL